MSRKLVRVGAFLLVASLSIVASRIYAVDRPPKPAEKQSGDGGDDPFGAEPPKSAAGDSLRVPEKYGRLLRAITVEDDRQTYGDFNDNGYWSGSEWKGHKNLPAGYWVYMAPQWYIFAKPLDNSAKAVEVPAKSPPHVVDDPFGGGDSSNPPAAKNLAPKPAKAAKPAPAVVANTKPKHAPTLHGGEAAILKALKRKATLQFTETPLKDVVDFISEKHRIPIQLDRAGLKDAGVDPEQPVTCNVSGISLQSALETILDELQLKWVIHHEMLLITSPQKAESDEFMYTKAYDVTDLLFSPQKYEATNPLNPAKEQHEPNFLGKEPTTIKPAPRGSSAMDRVESDLTAIADAISNTVSRNSWIDNGGLGTIDELDRMLIINQTREAHMRIQRFIADLRARRHAAPTLSVELQWIWLDAKHREQLYSARKEAGVQGGPIALDPKWVRKIAVEVPYIQAHTDCINGLATVVSSGDRRSVVTSANFTIDGSAVGYAPVVSITNVGVTAEIRSTVVPGTNSATLDLHSAITRWMRPRSSSDIGASTGLRRDAGKGDSHTGRGPVMAALKSSASCPIDLPVMPTQEFGTTLRVPLGKPVVVGSVTFAPSGDAGVGEAKKDAMEVYLIATTSVVKSEAVKKSKTKGGTKPQARIPKQIRNNKSE